MSSPCTAAHRGSRRLVRAAAVAAFASLSLAAPAGPASAQPTPDAEPPAPPTTDVTSDMPNVVLSKTYEPRDPDPAPGETITITVTLANKSSADGTGYVINGVLPPEIVDVTWTCTASGAGSVCGVESGAGDLIDTADIGAGGTVVYVLTGTIAPEAEGPFIQAVTLQPGPGQACEPVATVTSPRPVEPEPEQGDYGYGYPPYVWEMTCRVNNRITPEMLPVTPPESQEDPVVEPGSAVPASPLTPALPQTSGPSLVYLAGGGGAILAGATVLWLTRRRRA